MRTSYYAIPFLAAGTISVVMGSGMANAVPGLSAPIPATYPWCELDMFCYNDDIDIALEPRRNRDEVEYGGGAAFGSEEDDN